MLHRLFITSKFSKKQITAIVFVNVIMSIAIVKPYLNDLASNKTQAKQLKNEFDEKK